MTQHSYESDLGSSFIKTTMNANNSLLTQFFSNGVATTPVKQKFVDELWHVPSQPGCQVNIDAYFRLVYSENDPVFAQDNAIGNYEDIIYIVGIVRDNPTLPFTQIVELVEKRPALNTGRLKVSLSIELAVRLWLMSNIRNRMTSNQSLLQTSIPWTDRESLHSVVANHVKKQPVTTNDNFSEYMNVHDMKKIADFRFNWTNDLNSHLSLRSSTIYIFHNVSVLKRMKQSSK